MIDIHIFSHTYKAYNANIVRTYLKPIQQTSFDCQY